MVALGEHVDMMIGSLAVPSITNTTSTLLSRSDSASAQIGATDVSALDGVTAVGEVVEQNTASRSPSSSTTQSIIFDPSLFEMIYQDLDARTDQVLGEVPLRVAVATATYPQTRATAATTPQLYTTV